MRKICLFVIDAPLIAVLIWLSQVDWIIFSTAGSEPPFEPDEEPVPVPEPDEEPVPVPEPDVGDGFEPYVGDDEGLLVGFDP